LKAQNFTAADWQNVAKLVPGRNDAQCQYKWSQGHKSSITKTQWQKKEDEELFKIISEKGTKQWQEIADTLNEILGVSRNGKQCRERWYNFLNPEINRDPFTPQEDL
jgi:myb proto-oncogene protein